MGGAIYDLEFTSPGFCVVCCLHFLCRLPSFVSVYMVGCMCGCLTVSNLSLQSVVVCKVELLVLF